MSCCQQDKGRVDQAGTTCWGKASRSQPTRHPNTGSQIEAWRDQSLAAIFPTVFQLRAVATTPNLFCRYA